MSAYCTRMLELGVCTRAECVHINDGIGPKLTS